MTDGPLRGIRVADFSWVLAGPYCSMLMAMAGADVVRVESARRMDQTRTRPGAFNIANSSKRGIRLNAACPKGLALARALIDVSDVVVENYSPGTLARLGLGYEELSRTRPGLIMVSISAMGQTGPEGSYIAYGSNFAAISGMGYMTSYTDGIPSELRTPQDVFTGTAACFAVLAALKYRERTGRGQYIDLSASETNAGCLGDVLLDYQLNQREPNPIGNGHPFMAPHGVYPCKEEQSWITIAVANDAEWQALCRAMGRADLLEDARLSDQLGRWQHRDELDAQLAEWTTNFTDDEVMTLLQEVGVAAVRSFNNKDLYEDKHLQERYAYRKINPPDLDQPFTVLGPPFVLTDTPLDVYGPAPVFGQHNDEVFGDLLGLSSEEVERLVEEQVIF